MRVRIRINIDEAKNLQRFMSVLMFFVSVPVASMVIGDDLQRLTKHLRKIRIKKGDKKTTFTLDAMTLLVLMLPVADDCLNRNFDLPNQYLIRYACMEVHRYAQEEIRRMQESE